MSKVSFVRHFGERVILDEARDKAPPPTGIEMPSHPEFTDSMYEDVFRGAQNRLGLDHLEPRYEGGQKYLFAPDGFMFHVTGAFTEWPEGNDLDWGYGPPIENYGEWQRKRNEEKERLISGGMSPEDAEEYIEEEETWSDYFENIDTKLMAFVGKSVTFSYNHVGWGYMVNPEEIREDPYKEELDTVEVCVHSFQETWFEQAQRYIKLPHTASDRLLRTYEYSQPGTIPCYMGKYCEGSIDHMRVELVPIEEGVGDIHHPVINRLWVPERVRYYLDERYPGLLDMGSDYNTRSDWGNVMRMLGRLGAAFGGREGNVVDEIAERSTTEGNIVVINDPMIAHMDTEKLATQVEESIQTLNAQDPSKAREREREEKIRRDIEEKKKQLVVITDVDEPVYEIAKKVGQSDDWLEKHVRHHSSWF